MIPQIIEEFCSQHGLSSLSMQEGGSLKLSIDGIGDFQMIHSGSKFLTGLNRKIENTYLLNGRNILRRCHFRTSNFKPLHAQLRNNVLGLFYLFREEEITASLLSLSLDSLTNTMDEIFRL